MTKIFRILILSCLFILPSAAVELWVAPDANDANKKARNDSFQRWLELLKKI